MCTFNMKKGTGVERVRKSDFQIRFFKIFIWQAIVRGCPVSTGEPFFFQAVQCQISGCLEEVLQQYQNEEYQTLLTRSIYYCRGQHEKALRRYLLFSNATISSQLFTLVWWL